MPMVRRAAASNLGKFAATVEQSHLKKEIVSIFDNLTQDGMYYLIFVNLFSKGSKLEFFFTRIAEFNIKKSLFCCGPFLMYFVIEMLCYCWFGFSIASSDTSKLISSYSRFRGLRNQPI
jgi:hypothetical protein